ncbi:MGMT family protein [Candidatus Woesebacteria bacterium]|nr:MGMT family protein [Candidatus Woesebacteria bacterium]MCD8526711.1 MGMT family protein [Candidatus Woesebacteria bacterium]MCD8546545.1 MGMT family protein [Candidatus Woesebacteria bacterium]
MTPFAENVYAALRQVPPGQVTTYKALATALNTKAYQAIGQIMRRNPDAPHTPCHRVVASDGRLGGFMGQRTGSAMANKIRLLESEGVFVQDGRVVDFDSKVFTAFRLPAADEKKGGTK